MPLETVVRTVRRLYDDLQAADDIRKYAALAAGNTNWTIVKATRFSAWGDRA